MAICFRGCIDRGLTTLDDPFGLVRTVILRPEDFSYLAFWTSSLICWNGFGFPAFPTCKFICFSDQHVADPWILIITDNMGKQRWCRWLWRGAYEEAHRCRPYEATLLPQLHNSISGFRCSMNDWPLIHPILLLDASSWSIITTPYWHCLVRYFVYCFKCEVYPPHFPESDRWWGTNHLRKYQYIETCWPLISIYVYDETPWWRLNSTWPAWTFRTDSRSHSLISILWFLFYWNWILDKQDSARYRSSSMRIASSY